MTEPDKESSSSLPEVLESLARTPETTVTHLRAKASDFDSKKMLSSIRRSPCNNKACLGRFYSKRFDYEGTSYYCDFMPNGHSFIG